MDPLLAARKKAGCGGTGAGGDTFAVAEPSWAKGFGWSSADTFLLYQRLAP